MGKKIAVLAALGAGYYFAKKEIEQNPQGQFAKVVRSVTENPTVVNAKDTTKAKLGETVRKQGEVLTDKVADAVKERLFRPQHTQEPEPEYVDVQVEEVIDPVDTSTQR